MWCMLPAPAPLHPIQFEAGRLIMLEGEPGDEMFFLVSGRVQVVVRKNGTCKSRRDDAQAVSQAKQSFLTLRII